MRGRASSLLRAVMILEALRHVLDRTLKPVPALEKTVARGDARPLSARAAGDGWPKPREATQVDFESDD